MSGEERLKIVIDAENQGGDEIAGFAKSVKAADEAAESSKGAFGGMVTSLTDVKAGFDMASQAIGYIKQGFDETVGKAAAWGDAMGDLATKTGMTVEQSSTMAVVFENVGLSMQTLEAAAKSAAKNGIEFNMQALKAAALEYQALPEGAARAQFAMERFGRAGMEMTEILSRTSENLDELGTSAVNTGRVIDEKAAAAAERMAMRTRELEGRVEGLKVTLGNAAIPVILDTWDAFDKLNAQLGAGEISLNDYLVGMQRVTNGQAAATAAIERGRAVTSDLVRDTDRLTSSTEAAVVSTNSYFTATNAIDNALRDHKQALDDAANAQNNKNISDSVSTAIAAPIQKAQDSYTETVQRNAGELGKMRLELEKLQAAQGKQVEVVTAGKVTQNEYALAIQKAGDAHKRLSDNTDPEKQLALSVAAEQADAKVQGMSGSLGSATTVTIDNAAKMADLTEKIGDLEKKNGDAAKAVEAATKQLIFQKLSAGEDSAVQLELAKSLGIMSEKDYEAAKAALNLKLEFDNGKISLAEYAKLAKDLARDYEVLTGTASDAARSVQALSALNPGLAVQKAATQGEDFGGWTAPKTTGSNKPAAPAPVDNTVYGGAQAAGGDYWVTKPTWFLAGEAGPERATFTPAGQTTNMGGVTINISGAGDPQAVAHEVSRILAAQVRGLSSAGASVLGR